MFLILQYFVETTAIRLPQNINGKNKTKRIEID
jgi:hypothetical protein